MHLISQSSTVGKRMWWFATLCEGGISLAVLRVRYKNATRYSRATHRQRRSRTRGHGTDGRGRRVGALASGSGWVSPGWRRRAASGTRTIKWARAPDQLLSDSACCSMTITRSDRGVNFIEHPVLPFEHPILPLKRSVESIRHSVVSLQNCMKFGASFGARTFNLAVKPDHNPDGDWHHRGRHCRPHLHPIRYLHFRALPRLTRPRRSLARPNIHLVS